MGRITGLSFVDDQSTVREAMLTRLRAWLPPSPPEQQQQTHAEGLHIERRFSNNLFFLCHICRFVQIGRRFGKRVHCSLLATRSDITCRSLSLSLPALFLPQLLLSFATSSTQLQKFHEGAMAVLKHFKWKRHARLLGKQLADYLMSVQVFSSTLALPSQHQCIPLP